MAGRDFKSGIVTDGGKYSLAPEKDRIGVPGPGKGVIQFEIRRKTGNSAVEAGCGVEDDFWQHERAPDQVQPTRQKEPRSAG